MTMYCPPDCDARCTFHGGRKPCKDPRARPAKPKRSPIARRSWMKRGKKRLPARNPRQQAARRARYQKALRSAHTRALRKQVFKEQQGLCTCGQEPMTVLDHLTYARLGHELRSDVQGLGPRCNALATTGKRANWMGGRRNV